MKTQRAGKDTFVTRRREKGGAMKFRGFFFLPPTLVQEEKWTLGAEIHSLHACRLLSCVPKPAFLLFPKIYRLSRCVLHGGKEERQISKN